MRRYLIILFCGIFTLQGNAVEQEHGEVDKVLVKKSQRQLYLLKKGKIYRQYRISLGFAPRGHKQQQGDGRTPEGQYLIDYRNPHSQFYRSLHINYPNTTDKQRAKRRGIDPGGQIFIHGLPSGGVTNSAGYAKTDWTLGCLSVSNEAMDEIWRLVKNGTPIEIQP